MTRGFRQLSPLLIFVLIFLTADSQVHTAQSIAGTALREGDCHMKGFGFDVLTQDGQPLTVGVIQRVYVAGNPDDPPLVVLHELPGLRDADIDLGARLAKRYRVVMPLLFGAPGQDDTGLGKRQTCGADLFECKSTQAKHRILADLRPIVQSACGEKDCGIIGMCLTGTLPLWLLHEPHVVALVMAQPSLPFPRLTSPFSRGIDISESDTADAMKIASERHAAIFLIRLHGDIISSHHSFETLKKRLRGTEGVALSCREDTGEVFEHSSLVFDPKHEAESGRRFDALTEFLDGRLRGAAAPAPVCK